MQSYLHFAEHTGANEAPQATVILIDISDSMNITKPSPSRLAAAGEAGCRLIELKMQRYPNDLVALVVFSADARVIFPLQPVSVYGRSQQQALRRLTTESATNIAAGMDVTYQLLTGKASPAPVSSIATINSSLKALTRWLHDAGDDRLQPSTNDELSFVRPQVILLSDGETTVGPSPLPIAEKLKQPPIRACIQVIGIADHHDAEQLDEPTLKQIASKDSKGAPRYYLVTDAEALITKFRELSGHITRF